MVSNDSRNMAKGKRTKRRRLFSNVVAVTSLSTDGDDQNHLPSPSTYGEFYGHMEEDEVDIANCLMLLAHGLDHNHPVSRSQSEESETATTSTVKLGSYTYECKTCNRCFLSFQALGGHRASHKKPKAAIEEVKVVLEDNVSNPNKSRRIHECSMCGSKFSSGQALGGHMRRHRLTFPNLKKIKLPLDLNLPALDDDRDFSISPSAFDFTGNRPLGFCATALIDCHY